LEYSERLRIFLVSHAIRHRFIIFDEPVKTVLSVKDVRLANEEEVLAFSGYPVGGVPPFNQLQRVLLDPKVLENPTAIVGGGDISKLLELQTKDIVEFVKPTVADITGENR
jgi:prolyl-tRNA editing enzyme YbaK/EbsC (Cys-tRNA(Pro) deacylase)